VEPYRHPDSPARLLSLGGRAIWMTTARLSCFPQPPCNPHLSFLSTRIVAAIVYFLNFRKVSTLPCMVTRRSLRKSMERSPFSAYLSADSGNISPESAVHSSHFPGNTSQKTCT